MMFKCYSCCSGDLHLYGPWPQACLDLRFKLYLYMHTTYGKSIISDKHEQSLNKVLRGHQTEDEKKGFSETEIRVALAEHLLGKLAPGKSYVVDRRLKKKGKCRCGYDFCKSSPVFGSTGVGMYNFLSKIFVVYSYQLVIGQMKGKISRK